MLGYVTLNRRTIVSAPVTYFENFVSAPELKFLRLWNELNWEDRTARRREYWANIFDRPYTYGSGEASRQYFPQPTHEVIEEVTDALEAMLGFRYEACFLNGYAVGKNALSWHSDNDPAIDHSRPIAVVSLYDEAVIPVEVKETKNGPVIAPIKSGDPGARAIQFKPIGGDKTAVETLSLAQGSLALMAPGMQETHLHQIPNAGGYVTRPRISLTYRGLHVGDQL
jgi:alkylated DNA repair dioxygenase AlkB